MKNIFIIYLVFIPTMVLSQGLNIKWEDSAGREFSINSNSGELSYSIFPGDQIEYYDKYDDKFNSGLVGKIKKIGNLRIEYYDKYDDKFNSGIVGKVKSIGNIKIEYYDKYDDKYDSGIAGKIKKVGGLAVFYNDKYDKGPLGSIKGTSGSVEY